MICTIILAGRTPFCSKLMGGGGEENNYSDNLDYKYGFWGGIRSIVVVHWTTDQQVEQLILYLGNGSY